MSTSASSNLVEITQMLILRFSPVDIDVVCIQDKAMAVQSYQRRSKYQSKAKMLEEVQPFEVTNIKTATECYVDKETLRAFGTAVFT